MPQKLNFSKKLHWISNTKCVQSKKTYYFLCIINYILQTVSPTSNFKNRLFDLLGEYRNVVELRYMGFPTNWKEESMWKIWVSMENIKKNSIFAASFSENNSIAQLY